MGMPYLQEGPRGINEDKAPHDNQQGSLNELLSPRRAVYPPPVLAEEQPVEHVAPAVDFKIAKAGRVGMNRGIGDEYDHCHVDGQKHLFPVHTIPPDTSC